MSFANKVVIVTGGSSGIGAATAIAFSAEGAHVVIVGRNEANLAKVAEKCLDPLVIRADLTKDTNVKRIVEETINKFGQIDVVVNAAGTAIGSGRLTDGGLMDNYEMIMGLNVRAVVYLTSLAAPHLVKTKGNVVNISSVVGRCTILLNTMIYNMSKAAIDNFTICAAAELGALGVRVNAISPGPVETDFLVNSEINGEWDDFKKMTLLKKVAQPEEVADLVLFLASSKAQSITGSNYVIDSGVLCKSNV